MGSERRLHPLSWFFSAAKAARGFVLPWIFLLFASGGSNYQLWATIFVVPAAIGAAIELLVFRYRLDDDEMVIRDGILTRRERHIPYARIENIDLVRNPFHRLFNVALVRVETASGGKPEAVIRVLALDAVEEMRARVFADRRAGAATAMGEVSSDEGAAEDGGIDDKTAAELPLLKVPTSELVRLGLVTNKGMVVLGGAIGLLWQQSDSWGFNWWEDLEERVGAVRSWLAESALLGSAVAGVVTGLAIVLVCVALLRLLSIGWFILQLHGFRLSRTEEDVHAEYGLLSRVSRTIPTRRIQVLSTVESPLHRLFGRQTVELQTLGGNGEEGYDPEEGNFNQETKWLAPMVEAGRVPRLVRDVLPEVDLERLAWRPLAPGASARIFKRWTTGLVVVVLPFAVFGSPWALLAIPAAVAWAWTHARLTVKHARYALADWGIVWRSGWWNREMAIVRYDKIQTVARHESPFDRRRDMASILLDTAGAEMFGHTVDIPYLPRAEADDVVARLYAEASRREYRV